MQRTDLQLTIEDYTKGRILTLPITPRQFLAGLLTRRVDNVPLYPWLRTVGLSHRQAHVCVFREYAVTVCGESDAPCQLLFDEGILVDDGRIWWEDIEAITMPGCTTMDTLDELFPELFTEGCIEVNADRAELAVEAGVDLDWAFEMGLLDQDEWVARGYADPPCEPFHANEFHRPQL